MTLRLVSAATAALLACAVTAQADSSQNTSLNSGTSRSTTDTAAGASNTISSMDDSGSSEEMAGQAAGRDNMSMDMMQKAMQLNQLHHINQKEIKMSELAAEKAQSPQVKSAAQQILKDHQDADKRVEALAKADNITLESFQPATHEKVVMDNLKKLEGARFDQAFVDNMHMGHKHVAQTLEMARTDSKDAKVKGLIGELLPQIRRHQQLSAGIKLPTASSPSDQAAGQAGYSVQK